jgi:membrane fusion protein (multidrug efflux system)
MFSVSQCSKAAPPQVEGYVTFSLPRLTFLLLALALPACKKKAPAAGPPPEVTLAEVVQQDVPVYIEAVGETRGSQTVEIRARVSGYLDAMTFTEGGPVKKGQLMYQIDPKPFQATLARAQAQVAAAKSQFDNADLEEKRLRPLADIKAVSRQEYDDAFAARQTGEAQLEAARAAEQTARIDLGYSSIRSPLTGIAGFTEAQIGDLVGPGARSLLTTVSEADPLWVRFAIPEREYLRLYRQTLETGGTLRAKDQDIRMFLADGTEYPEKGTPRVANRAVDPATGTLQIEVAFPNRKGLIRPGQFARIKVRTDVKKGALLVPQRAVRELQGQYSVAVVGPDSRVKMTAVTPSDRVGSLWVIDQGVKPGEKVVVEGLQRLRDSMTVKVKGTVTDSAATQKAAEGIAPKPAGKP